MEYYKEDFTCNIVKHLVEIGGLGINTLIPLDDPSNPGQSFFEIAIWNRDHELFEYLLESKADPNIRSADLSTPLHSIVSSEYIDIFTKVVWASRLISAGAEVNATMRQDDGLTPLHFAVSGGYYPLAVILIFNGADVNMMTNTGFQSADQVTPIYMSHSEDNKMVELLPKNGASTNIRAPNTWRTPLIDAIQYGDLQRITLLIMYGADVNFTTGVDDFNNDELPLHIAVKENFPEAVKLLLGFPDIDVNAVNADGESVLHFAARYADNLEIVRDLLDAGVNVNIVNSRGQTASNCVEENSVTIVIKEYLVALQVAGLFINDINLNAIKNNSYEDLRSNCLGEIKIMKETFITLSNVRFNNVFLWGETRLVNYLKHIDKDEFMKSLAELNVQIYRGKLSYIFKYLSAKISLVKYTEWYIYETLGDKVPDTFLRRICDYYSNEDLKEI